jgi:hypothetical protein
MLSYLALELGTGGHGEHFIDVVILRSAPACSPKRYSNKMKSNSGIYGYSNVKRHARSCKQKKERKRVLILGSVTRHIEQTGLRGNVRLQQTEGSCSGQSAR